MPKIENPEDFLQFADDKLVDLGPSGEAYSNLGLLLVGLSLQHLYNSSSKSSSSLKYHEILQKFVLEPAGIVNFTTHKPRNGCINLEDESSVYNIGGPAGGYWTSASELLKMGEWLKIKCRNERFMHLMETYGGEFYKAREIVHGGGIGSASSYLSHRLDNGITISILSNTAGLGAANDLCDVIQEHLFV